MAVARKPPLVRCKCGRQHRSWNAHKVCNACVREQRRENRDELHRQIREETARRLTTTQEERDRHAIVHAQWLARFPDHPWNHPNAEQLELEAVLSARETGA